MRFCSVLLLPIFLKAVASSIMDSKTLSSSIAKFSAKFCNELDKSTSVVSSPLSAEYILALVALGCEGPAHEEILQSLGFPEDNAIRSSFSSMSSQLKSIKGITLNVANRVYIQDGGYKLNSALESDAVKVFDAGLKIIDFGSGGAAQEINKWVESKTNERIKDLLTSDSVNSDTRLVLVNALYFKGSWLKPFHKMMTYDRPFFLDESTTVDIPMMNAKDDFFYGESKDLGVQYLKMQYEGEEASMLVVLPSKVDGLNDVIKKLADGYDLLADVETLEETKVDVTIPKFKIETEIDLMDVLPKLGIKTIFEPANSGLTRMLDSEEKLFVSKGVQKAFIEVNEEGAEAAAASAMGVMMCCAIMEPPTPEFTADRPFLAVILVGNDVYFEAIYRGKP
ncbi:antichymotrypsin-2 isoform X2 [Pieris rapae]|uniref:antichymotrypsin-2 isoform X2 n=1 Tax=Pieris rapae TaxID=64459 RepID=UPI001E27E632|nr:antichymotrypsin-2 isoform X2 [Pieris rapae]